ncbi:ABC transporter ATP-binding protein [Paenibacillus sp. D51F]
MLAVEHLSKTFPGGKGIFDLSFSVAKGEAFGFLGPNGSGKSTTIRHIMGFMKPDRGSASVGGRDAWAGRGRVQRMMGYLPGEISFVEGMTGRSFLDFMADMQGVNDSGRREELTERFQFDERTPIRKMSKGMKQKVGIVAAFMHRPEVVVLDEPTSGLDPLMQKVFIDLVLEEKARGAAILMSSHSFAEIEQTCDRAAIIKDGILLAVKNIRDLQSMQRKLFELGFESDADARAFAEEAGPGAELLGGCRVRLAVQGGYDRFLAAASRYRVVNMEIHRQSLEDVFMDFYDRRENGL